MCTCVSHQTNVYVDNIWLACSFRMVVLASITCLGGIKIKPRKMGR